MPMNDQYKYFEKPLTLKMARELIQELFAGQTVQKQEIMRVVVEKHLERGGLPATARSNNPVTLALWHLKRGGQANNPSEDNWLILSSPQDDDSVNSERDNLVPERTIGSGKQSVYLYYYPAYQILAELQDEEVWACKIGRSRSGAISRIRSQTRTALPEFPKVGLIIKTDESGLMEKAIQYILRIQGKQKQDAPGNEWFITSSSEVEQVYENIFGNSQ